MSQLSLGISRHGDNIFVDGLPGRHGSVHANAYGAFMQVSGERQSLHITTELRGPDVIVKLSDGPIHIQQWTVQGSKGSVTLNLVNCPP